MHIYIYILYLIHTYIYIFYLTYIYIYTISDTYIYILLYLIHIYIYTYMRNSIYELQSTAFPTTNVPELDSAVCRRAGREPGSRGASHRATVWRPWVTCRVILGLWIQNHREISYDIWKTYGKSMEISKI